MIKTLMFFFVLAMSAQTDDLVEFRSASKGEYRYADWSHSFSNKLATDLYYVGVPGANEATMCLGYTLPTRATLSLTPFFCGGFIKEGKVAGVKSAVIATWQKGALKADAFYAFFKPMQQTASTYHVLDAGNVTYSVTKTWELGASVGFFTQGGLWQYQAGPLVRRNDRAGYWGVTCRFGNVNELRFIRSFNIKTRGEP